MMNHSDALSSSLVTSINIRIVENGHDGLIAWASCVVAHTIKLDNIGVRRGRDGCLFLTYPAKVTSTGGKHHYFNPISSVAAKAVQDAVLARLASLAKAAAEGGAQVQ